MPLTIGLGETKTIQLQAESYRPRVRHYAGGQFLDCTGAGCALCAAGVRQNQGYALPISIGGVAEEWIFPLGVSQQLDAFTQQGYKLLGLIVKVSRTGSGTQTRYQVFLAEGQQPTSPPVAVAQPVARAQPAYQVGTALKVLDEISRLRASDWAKVLERCLLRADFLDIIASEFQVMKDEGLWR